MYEINELMITKYCIRELGYDFMGYPQYDKKDVLTFHHLVIPKREKGKRTIENGAILYRMPHNYLHLIEHYDLELFFAISSEMLDMNIKGYLDMTNIIQINKLLGYFEEEFKNKYIHGKPIIKEEYTRRLIKK